MQQHTFDYLNLVKFIWLYKVKLSVCIYDRENERNVTKSALRQKKKFQILM